VVISDLHPWDVTYKEAVKIQKDLKGKVCLKKINKRIKYVAGLDISYAKGSNIMWAGVVVLDFPSLNKAEERWSQKKVSFPYIPGLLSFREIPALIDALRKLEIEPDLIFYDGQGILHTQEVLALLLIWESLYIRLPLAVQNHPLWVHIMRLERVKVIMPISYIKTGLLEQ